MKSGKKTIALILQCGAFIIGLHYFTACKKDTSSPVVSGPPITTGTTPTTKGVPAPQTLCGDTICGLPYKLNPEYLPSGFYTGAESSVIYKMDTLPGVTGQVLKIAYPWNGGYWGAGFLKNNSWDASKNKIVVTAKKITFSVYLNYTFNVTFLPFGDTKYGNKYEFYPDPNLNSNAPYKWVKVELNLTSLPTSYAMVLGIVMDGMKQPSGGMYTIYIKDMQFE
jgi:hypothetical protein